LIVNDEAPDDTWAFYEGEFRFEKFFEFLAECFVVVFILFMIMVFFSGCGYETNTTVVIVDNGHVDATAVDSGTNYLDAGSVDVLDAGASTRNDGGVVIDAGECFIPTEIEIYHVKGSIPYVNDILHFNHGDGVVESILSLKKCNGQYILLLEVDACCGIRPGMVTWGGGGGVLKELHNKSLQDCK
jgi:hypothetical protein